MQSATTTTVVHVVIDDQPSSPVWADAAYLGLLVTLAAALITAWVTLWAAKKARNATRRSALAAQYGAALADALAWRELPYRVARRSGDDAATLGKLADGFHELHERIEHHRQWTRLESPAVGDTYANLLDTLRRRADDAIKFAWTQRSAITKPEHMVLGDVPELVVNVDAECAAYVEAVKAELDKLVKPERKR